MPLAKFVFVVVYMHYASASAGWTGRLRGYDAHSEDMMPTRSMSTCLLQGMHLESTLGNYGIQSLSRLQFQNSLHLFSHSPWENMTWTWVCITLVLLTALPIIVWLMGGLPEPQAGVNSLTTTPPALVTFFTGVVCIGAIANVTLVIPSVEDVSNSLQLSGYVIGAYAAGALIGLPLFRQLPVSSLRSAYLFHACCMILGNLTYTIAGILDISSGLIVGRIIAGLEGGVMYNTNLAIVHFARGKNRTGYLVLYQFFIALGLISGPVIAAACQTLSATLGASSPEVYANGFMAAWGVVLVMALLCAFPADIADLERTAGVPTVPVPAASSGQSSGQSTSTHSGQSAEEALNSCDSGKGWQQHALALTLFNASLVRVCLRLLWESGAMVVFEDQFGWSIGVTGVAYASVMACQACLQFIFARFVAGSFPDTSLTRGLEVSQLLGIFLMFKLVDHNVAERGLFLAGSVIAYSSNAVWAGVCYSYCLKRTVPGSSWSTENLLVLSQVSIFLGIGLGGVISRSVLSVLHSGGQQTNVLAGMLLAGAASQLWFSFVIITPDAGSAK